MDAYDATRMVYSRVQAMEPANVSKIMGYLLLQDQGEHEMFRLAFSHDAVLQALVSEAKKDLGLPSSSPSRTSSMSSSPQQFSSPYHLPYHIAPSVSQHFPRSVSLPGEHLNSPYLNAEDDLISPSIDPSRRIADLNAPPRINSFPFQNQLAFHDRPPELSIRNDMNLADHLIRNDMHLTDQFSFLNESRDSPNAMTHEGLHPDMLAMLDGNLNADSFHPTSNGRRFSTSDLLMSPDNGTSSVWKPCLYYARGYCKHGSNCRFLHSQVSPDSSFIFPNNGLQDYGNDDTLVPGSLERLEFELHELLRNRKAPVSIASLPQLYHERFGKTLQAEGYLTESQRHGKAGYSLTKLLSRLKNSVTLIDRPHGQHAVVLAEDAYKFTAYRGDKDDLSGVNPGSRQIYLTFPAESAFTEEDVSAHFRVYGPVQDVRIPYQQKRMFGFVRFIYPETVKVILAKGNPHYICGARVLVKPYKEKGKHGDRKFSDREYPRLLTEHGLENREYDYLSGPRFFLEHDIIRRRLEEQELILELERRRLAELQVEKERRQSESVHAAVRGTAGNAPSGLSSSEDVLGPLEGLHLSQPQASNAFESLVDALDNHLQNDELEPSEKRSVDRPSDEDNLPDSPFTSPHKGFSLSDKVCNLIVEERPESHAGIAVSSAATDVVKELNCRVCMDFSVDPIELECGHFFCVQCIFKVIRMSKDECPVCQQHIGSQIVKVLESRRLQVIDPSLATGGQAIW